MSTKEIPEFVPPGEPLNRIEQVLRTPDECFASLPGFPYKPRYMESRSHGNVRIHYIDEGPRDARETVLLMHGEPTWCYLYRHMIPVFLQAGYRVLAPDLVGFGRSDKPSKREDYSYERQVDWMSDFVVAVGLDNCTAFLQDWGGLIGLRLVARFPERFLRVVASNTALPMGGGAASKAFKLWAAVQSQQMPHWGRMVQSMTKRKLSEEEIEAYEAPFPSEEFKMASRVYPRSVPRLDEHASVEENKGAFRRVFQRFKLPFLTLFADSDPITKGGERIWQAEVPGASGMKHETVVGAAHFLQECKGKEVAEKVLAFMRDNPVPCNPPPAQAKL